LDQVYAYFFFIVFQLFSHDTLLVINRQVDLVDASLLEAFDLMAQEWLVGEIDQRFGHRQSQGAKSVAVSTNQN